MDSGKLVFYLFMCVFLAALGLCCFCVGFLQLQLHFIAACRLLIVVASLVVEHGLWALGLSSSRTLEHRLSSCGTRAWLLLGMWNLPRPEIKPVSPALADRFLISRIIEYHLEAI